MESLNLSGTCTLTEQEYQARIGERPDNEDVPFAILIWWLYSYKSVTDERKNGSTSWNNNFFVFLKNITCKTFELKWANSARDEQNYAKNWWYKTITFL